MTSVFLFSPVPRLSVLLCSSSSCTLLFLVFLFYPVPRLPVLPCSCTPLFLIFLFSPIPRHPAPLFLVICSPLFLVCVYWRYSSSCSPLFLVFLFSPLPHLPVLPCSPFPCATPRSQPCVVSTAPCGWAQNMVRSSSLMCSPNIRSSVAIWLCTASRASWVSTTSSLSGQVYTSSLCMMSCTHIMHIRDMLYSTDFCIGLTLFKMAAQKPEPRISQLKITLGILAA